MKKKKDLDLAPSRRERKTLGQYILLFFLVAGNLLWCNDFYHSCRNISWTFDHGNVCLLN